MGGRVVLCSLFLLFPSLSLLVSSNQEGDILYGQKQLFGRDPNNCTDNWDSYSADPCSWTGVTCNNYVTPPTVTQLYLVNCSLSGTLSAELGGLVNLEQLNMDNNYINGGIPEELQNLKNLKGLDLQSNRLSGPIPDFLCNLTSLNNLFLGDNPSLGQAPPCLLAKIEKKQITSDLLQPPPPGVGSGSISSPPISIGLMFMTTITMCLAWWS